MCNALSFAIDAAVSLHDVSHHYTMPAGPKCCTQTLNQQLLCSTEPAHGDENSPNKLARSFFAPPVVPMLQGSVPYRKVTSDMHTDGMLWAGVLALTAAGIAHLLQ